jgi:hypothetical protein
MSLSGHRGVLISCEFEVWETIEGRWEKLIVENTKQRETLPLGIIIELGTGGKAALTNGKDTRMIENYVGYSRCIKAPNKSRGIIILPFVNRGMSSRGRRISRGNERQPPPPLNTRSMPRKASAPRQPPSRASYRSPDNGDGDDDDDDDSADSSDDSDGNSEDFPAFSALERGTLLQCASYALELLSHRGWRRYIQL